MTEKFLRITEVMKLLDVKAPATILKAITDDQIQAIKIGSQWRFPADQFKGLK